MSLQCGRCREMKECGHLDEKLRWYCEDCWHETVGKVRTCFLCHVASENGSVDGRDMRWYCMNCWRRYDQKSVPTMQKKETRPDPRDAIRVDEKNRDTRPVESQGRYYEEPHSQRTRREENPPASREDPSFRNPNPSRPSATDTREIQRREDERFRGRPASPQRRSGPFREEDDRRNRSKERERDQNQYYRKPVERKNSPDDSYYRTQENNNRSIIRERSTGIRERTNPRERRDPRERERTNPRECMDPRERERMDPRDHPNNQRESSHRQQIVHRSSEHCTIKYEDDNPYYQRSNHIIEGSPHHRSRERNHFDDSDKRERKVNERPCWRSATPEREQKPELTPAVKEESPKNVNNSPRQRPITRIEQKTTFRSRSPRKESTPQQVTIIQPREVSSPTRRTSQSPLPERIPGQLYDAYGNPVNITQPVVVAQSQFQTQSMIVQAQEKSLPDVNHIVPQHAVRPPEPGHTINLAPTPVRPATIVQNFESAPRVELRPAMIPFTPERPSIRAMTPVEGYPVGSGPPPLLQTQILQPVLPAERPPLILQPNIPFSRPPMRNVQRPEMHSPPPMNQHERPPPSQAHLVIAQPLPSNNQNSISSQPLLTSPVQGNPLYNSNDNHNNIILSPSHSSTTVLLQPNPRPAIPVMAPPPNIQNNNTNNNHPILVPNTMTQQQQLNNNGNISQNPHPVLVPNPNATHNFQPPIIQPRPPMAQRAILQPAVVQMMPQQQSMNMSDMMPSNGPPQMGGMQTISMVPNNNNMMMDGPGRFDGIRQMEMVPSQNFIQGGKSSGGKGTTHPIRLRPRMGKGKK